MGSIIELRPAQLRRPGEHFFSQRYICTMKPVTSNLICNAQNNKSIIESRPAQLKRPGEHFFSQRYICTIKPVTSNLICNAQNNKSIIELRPAQLKRLGEHCGQRYKNAASKEGMCVKIANIISHIKKSYLLVEFYNICTLPLSSPPSPWRESSRERLEKSPLPSHPHLHKMKKIPVLHKLTSK